MAANPTQPLAMEAGVAWTDDRGANLEVYFDAASTDDSGVEAEESAAGPALLVRCRPNPFRASTAISFDLTAQTSVDAAVYDVSGRQVRSIAVSAALPPGESNLEWDGRDDAGSKAGPGIYFLRVTAEGVTSQTKVVILK